MKPDVVVFSSADAGFNRQQWTEGTARVLERLSPASRRIFILADTPSLPFDGPDCLMRHIQRPAWLQQPGACSAPAASMRPADVQTWIRSAAARFPNVEVMDLNARICPDGICRAELDGQVVFRDNQHLSGAFAESLADDFSNALQHAR